MSSRWLDMKTPEQLYAASLRERAQHWLWLAEMMYPPELTETTLAEVEKLVREAEAIERRFAANSECGGQAVFPPLEKSA